VSESNGTARLAVLLSGSGRTLENLLRAIERGTLSASVVAVVSSKPGVRGLEIAQAAGIPATVIERRGFADDAAFTSAIPALGLAPSSSAGCFRVLATTSTT